jgi:CheY-like chemotaxis protein
MNRRVLLIDSDLGFRDTLTRELAPYRVVVATEPESDQALALATADPPTLIVLAIDEATKKAGFRVFEKCKKGALSKVPIILVTSTVPPDAFLKHRSLKTHADDYIDKRTMSTHELVGKIDGLIALGDPIDDASSAIIDEELAIPLEDEVPMEIAEGDVVLDEFGEHESPISLLRAPAVEDDASHEFDSHDARTVGPNDALSIDEVVGAETDAAFAAMLDDAPAGPYHEAVPEPVPPPMKPVAEIVDDVIPEPIHDGRGRGTTPPPLTAGSIPGIIVDEPRDIPLPHRAATAEPVEAEAFDEPLEEPIELHSPVPRPDPEPEPEPEAIPALDEPMLLSQPAIPIDDDELLAFDEDVPVEVEPADPEPASTTLAAVPAIEPEPEPEPLAPPAPAPAPEPMLASVIESLPVMSRTSTGSGSHPAIDLGLDMVAENARNEQSGVYDRRALRKIGELERQISQLKTELERARAAGEGVKGGREAQFLNLRESMLAKDKELGQTKSQLAGQAKELDDAREKLRVAQHAKATLESKNSELEQRLFDDSTRGSELAAAAKAAQAHLGKLEKQLEHVTAAKTAAESALGERDKELATRAASASEGERALRAERDQLVAKHQAELAAAKQASDAAAAAAKRDAETAVAAAKRDAEAAVAAAKRDAEAALEAQRTQAEAAREAALAELREELETAHGAALSEAVEEVRHANAAEHQEAVAALERAHSGDMVALKADHAGVQGSVRRELAGEIERLKAALAAAETSHQNALVAAAATHANALDAAVASHRAELAQRDQLLEAVREELGEDHAAALAESEARASQALAEQRAKTSDAEQRHAEAVATHRAELERVAAKHAAELDHRAAEHAAALLEHRADTERQAAALIAERDRIAGAAEHAEGALREQHRAALDEQAQRHEQVLAKLHADRDSLADAAKRAAEAHRAALGEAEARNVEKLSQLQDAAGREIAESKASALVAKRAADEAVATARNERDAAEAAHAQSHAEQEAKHERALALANGELVRQKAVSDAEHGRAITAMQAEAEQARAALISEHARVIKELTTERDELKRGLSSARDGLKRSEGELASAVESIADRNAELRTHVAAIAERDTRIAELRKEIAAIEAENTSYQEQVLRAYQKIKQDEAMVTRAKKAMAIALTVLDDQGNPTT